MSDTLMLHLAFSVFVLDVTLLLMWRGKVERERAKDGRKWKGNSEVRLRLRRSRSCMILLAMPYHTYINNIYNCPYSFFLPFILSEPK
jgi:hypothetical protein